MSSKKSILTFIAISILLTLLDILIVETIYRPTEAWDTIYQYHYIYWLLILIVPLLASYKLQSLIPMVTYLFFIFGIEDTAFYGLQGYLPKIYWGVSICGIWQPTLDTVIILNIIGTILIVISIALINKVDKSLKRWIC